MSTRLLVFAKSHPSIIPDPVFLSFPGPIKLNLFLSFQGSPYNRSDLRAVNVNTADMCILLSPGHGSEEDEHQALSDKEVILVTLNLKGS